MVDPTHFCIFVLCLLGCSVQSWRMGIQRGAEATIEFLEDKGLLILDEED